MTGPTHDVVDGSVLGLPRYGALRRVADRGVGAVYDTYDERHKRRILLRVGIEDDAAAIRAAFDVWLRFSPHQNVRLVFNQINSDDGSVAALEMAACQETLEDRILRAGPLSLAETLALGLGLARGTREMHRGNVVHGGIAPWSVVISTDSEPQLSELGFATPAVAGRTDFVGDVNAIGRVLIEAIGAVLVEEHSADGTTKPGLFAPGPADRLPDRVRPVLVAAATSADMTADDLYQALAELCRYYLAALPPAIDIGLAGSLRDRDVDAASGDMGGGRPGGLLSHDDETGTGTGTAGTNSHLVAAGPAAPSPLVAAQPVPSYLADLTGGTGSTPATPAASAASPASPASPASAASAAPSWAADSDQTVSNHPAPVPQRSRSRRRGALLVAGGAVTAAAVAFGAVQLWPRSEAPAPPPPTLLPVTFAPPTFGETEETAPAVDVIPEAPSGVELEFTAQGQVELSWTDNSSSEGGYVVQMAAFDVDPQLRTPMAEASISGWIGANGLHQRIEDVEFLAPGSESVPIGGLDLKRVTCFRPYVVSGKRTVPSAEPRCTPLKGPAAPTVSNPETDSVPPQPAYRIEWTDNSDDESHFTLYVADVDPAAPDAELVITAFQSLPASTDHSTPMSLTIALGPGTVRCYVVRAENAANSIALPMGAPLPADDDDDDGGAPARAPHCVSTLPAAP